MCLSRSPSFPSINPRNLTFESMPDHQYKFNVHMGCSGCSGAIKEAVETLTGVKDSSICLEDQTVFVVAEPSLSYETVLGAIKAKGKNVRSGEADGVAQTV